MIIYYIFFKRLYFAISGEECRKLYDERTVEKKIEKDLSNEADESSSGAPEKEEVLSKNKIIKKNSTGREQLLDETWPDKDELLVMKKDHVGSYLHHEARVPEYTLDNHSSYGSRHRDYATPGSSASDYGTGQSDGYSDRSYGSTGYHSTASGSNHSTPVSQVGASNYDYHNHHYPPNVLPPSSSSHFPAYHPQIPPPSTRQPPPPFVPPPLHQPPPPIPPPPPPHMPPPPIHHLPPPPVQQSWQPPWNDVIPRWEQPPPPSPAVRQVPLHAGTVTTLPPANATPTWTPVSGDGRSIVFSPERTVVSKKEKTSIKSSSHRYSETKSPETPKVLDLDTRIEMLLKGKGAGGMAPSFLRIGIGSDSDEETKSKAKVSSRRSSSGSSKHSNSRHRRNVPSTRAEPISKARSSSSSDSDEGVPTLRPVSSDIISSGSLLTKNKDDSGNEPLSVPPSPFLSEEIYHKWFQIGIEQVRKAREREQEETTGLLESVRRLPQDDDLGSLISSSEDETLTANRGDYSPKHPGLSALNDLPPGVDPETLSRKSTPLQDENRDDDRMSLSSLSSEEKIEVSSGPQQTAVPNYPPPQFVNPAIPPPSTTYPPPYTATPFFPHHLPPPAAYPSNTPDHYAAWSKPHSTPGSFHFPPLYLPPPGFPASGHCPSGITSTFPGHIGSRPGQYGYPGYPVFSTRLPPLAGQIHVESSDPQAPTIK